MSEQFFNIAVSTPARGLVHCRRFGITSNRITFLFGESGIGKSLLSKAVYGLLDPGELEVTLNGLSYPRYLVRSMVKETVKNGFFVFQEPSSHFNPLLTIAGQLEEGSLHQSTDTFPILKALWAGDRVSDIPALLSLFPKPYRPSGGEKQRVLLAMALKKILRFQALPQSKPHLFVFDEPTGSLDNRYRNLVLRLLFNQYRKRPFTILFITHDYSIISEVMESHRDLLDSMLFKELCHKGESEAVLETFSPGSYLGWLKGLKPVLLPDAPATAVLHLRRDIRIFGRELCIYQDRQLKNPKDLFIQRGEMVYLKAPSGTGKTSLAKILLGLYRADGVAMRLGGLKLDNTTPPDIWRKSIWGKVAGMVFQHADESLNLAATVRETFTGLPLGKKLTDAGIGSLLGEVFENKAVETFLDKKVAHLSGGQKQRLNLLRTLCLGVSLVILDEPLNGLDFISVKKVLALLERKRREGCAFLIISHNEEIFDLFIPQKRVFYLGKTN